MNTVKITVGLHRHDYNDDQISGYCTDLSVAMKRLGLEVNNTRETPFKWYGYFENPFNCDKKMIRKYLDSVNADLFKIQVHDNSK